MTSSKETKHRALLSLLANTYVCLSAHLLLLRISHINPSRGLLSVKHQGEIQREVALLTAAVRLSIY